MKLDPYISRHSQKFTQNEFFEFLKPDTIKLLEENMWKNLIDIDLGNNFGGMMPKHKLKEKKNQQMGLHQTQKLLHSKRNN